MTTKLTDNECRYLTLLLKHDEALKLIQINRLINMGDKVGGVRPLDKALKGLLKKRLVSKEAVEMKGAGRPATKIKIVNRKKAKILCLNHLKEKAARSLDFGYLP